jgi:hypothetical protein
MHTARNELSRIGNDPQKEQAGVVKADEAALLLHACQLKQERDLKKEHQTARKWSYPGRKKKEKSNRSRSRIKTTLLAQEK